MQRPNFTTSVSAMRTNPQKSLLAFFLKKKCICHVLHPEGKPLRKSFQPELFLQKAPVRVEICRVLQSAASLPALESCHTEGKSLGGFVHVCVSVVVRLCVHLCKTFMQSMYAAQARHHPNEPLPWQRQQCEGGAMTTDYSLPT